jgi:hypothetical protein
MFVSSESITAGIGGYRRVGRVRDVSSLDFTMKDLIRIKEKDGGKVLIFNATVIVSLLLVRILVRSVN